MVRVVNATRRPFYPRKTSDTLCIGAGWAQGRSEQARKISPPTCIRSPNLPARSESLNRLSDPGQTNNNNNNNRLTTGNTDTLSITHNAESTAVWILKPERWGSPLVQEKYQEGNKNNNVTILNGATQNSINQINTAVVMPFSYNYIDS
jgi:hypothetical protein